MLVNSKELLIKASRDGYAVPAYNINNLEWTRFILEACNQDRSPVILGVTEGAVKYFGGYKVVYNVVSSLISELNIKVPVVLHLDHGLSIESCKEAIDAGFTSVMLDASSKPLEENIKETIVVKNYADSKNVSVEAEVGTLAGVEDGVSEDSVYSSLDDCISFVSETNVDSLAPSIGNAHGIYKTDAKLNFELLGNICKSVKLPLVLHGASGLDDNKLTTAVFCGVSKVNINTDLQIAWTSAVRTYLSENKEAYDPRKIIKSGERAIKDTILRKNAILGSKNKAF